MDYILKIDLETTKYLSFLYNNNLIKISLLLILGLYFVISPKLPQVVYLLYNNIIFRSLIIFIIIFLCNHDIQLAIMIATIYLVTLNNINNTYNKRLV